jgi:hypothetical protein
MRYALSAQSIEVDACLSQQLDALGDHAFPLQVKLQMELPSGGPNRQSPHGIRQSEPYLDEFGPLHIVPGVLVIQFLSRVEVAQRGTRDHTAGEFCVLHAGRSTKAMMG